METMSESLLTVTVAGLLVGFIFSMPIAGPISILVVSNALRGRLKYCNFLSVGASFANLVYVFIAVYGITRFYSFYKPAIPFIMGAGSVFILFVSYRIIRTNINLDDLDGRYHLSDKIKHTGKGGFYTGLLVAFLNPTLFFGWLTSSFITITIISGLGFNTGGLDRMIDTSINEINTMGGAVLEKPDLQEYLTFDTAQMHKNAIAVQEVEKDSPENFHLLISLFFAVALSVGTIIWFVLLGQFIFRCRKKIKINILNLCIKGLGVILGILGAFILYKSLGTVIYEFL